jgi:hypothetical protein
MPVQRIRRETLVERETEDNLDQDSNHSVQDVHIQEVAPTNSQETASEVPIRGRLARLRLPPTSGTEWHHLDQDLDRILEARLKGKNKLDKITSIVYEICKDRFGVEEKNESRKKDTGPSRRQKEIGNIRRELRQLKHNFNRASEGEKQGLEALREGLRAKLKSLKKAERLRKQRAERRKTRSNFFKNPFKFVGELLGKPKSGRLNSTKEEIDASIKASHEDPQRDVPLGDSPDIRPVPAPIHPFDMKEIQLKEVKDVIRKARSGSAPGPSGLTYKIYKNCPLLTIRLWKLIKVVWRDRELPSSWLIAEGCYVPKEENSSELNQFREISLLSVEGKIFWSVISRRMTKFFIDNKYVDTSIQKGGISGFAGCIEHTAAMSQLIGEAKKNKAQIAVVWLDLAKAYPSVSHQLIFTALEHYHIPEEVTGLISKHLGGLQMRFSSGDITSSWQRLEKGIMAGCTISVILFVAAINMLLGEATKECRGPESLDGIQHPSCRAFMDDVTVMTSHEIGMRWVLRRLDTLATWSRLTFKPEKSRSLILKKGIPVKTTFTIQSKTIPTITDNPIKSLGKWFDVSLGDKNHQSSVFSQLNTWLKSISNTTLPGFLKAWCFQYGILPRLGWPFSIYDFPLTLVERMEKMANRYLREWFGVSKSFSDVNLYSKTSPASLPVGSIVEEFKVNKVRTTMLLRYSKDKTVRGTEEKTPKNRKWSPQEAISEAESKLRVSDIMGTVADGRKGLGNYGTVPWTKANTNEKRQMVIAEVRKGEEEQRRVKAVGMSKQGSWMNWDNVESRRLTGNQLLQENGTALSFFLRAVSDTLPSNTNLVLWKKLEDPTCVLCQDQPASLKHVLSSCKRALSDRRYAWRHDKVLNEIAQCIEPSLKTSKLVSVDQGLQHIEFVKAGMDKPVKSTSGKLPSGGLLHSASDWKMQVDTGSQLVFPQEITTTRLRPDIIITSVLKKCVILIELTVPWEDRIEESHELKRSKYDHLLLEARDKGWNAYCFPVESGCRGFPSKSMSWMLRKLGMSSSSVKKAISSIGRETERCSRWLWLKRNSSWLPQ